MSNPINNSTKSLLEASLNRLPGALTLPPGLSFYTLHDGTSMTTFELGAKALEFGGVTLATLEDLSCLVTVNQDGQIVGEVDATLQLGPKDSPIELQLGGVFTDRTPAPTTDHSTSFQDWSLFLTAAAVHGLPLGKLVADLIPGLPDDLGKFALNNLRMELRWDAGSPVISEDYELSGNPTTDDDSKVDPTATPSITQSTVFQMLATGRLGGDDPWEVIPGLLSLTGPRVVVGIEGGHKFLDLYERLELFGFPWAVKLQLPSGVGSAELVTQDGVTMESFIEHFGLHDPSDTLKDIAIKRAAVRFDAHNHLLGVNLELGAATGGGWCLGPSWLKLTDVAFELVHTPAGVAGRASASLSLAGATFNVSLEHAGPGLGWQIEASSDLGTSPPKLADLLKTFGYTNNALPAFSLSSVLFSYDTLTGTLALGGAGKLGSPPEDPNQDKRPQAELSLTHTRGHQGEAGWGIHGQLIIADAILAFTVQKDASETDMVAGYAAGGSGGLSLGKLLGELLKNPPDPNTFPDLTLQSALFARKGNTKLIAANVDLEIPSDTLHKIPVLGERLSKDASFGLTIHAIYSSAIVSDQDLAGITPLAPSGTPTLPSPVPAGFGGTTVEVRIGSKTFQLGGIQPAFTTVGGQPGTSAPDASTPTPPPTPVHQNLGGVLDIRSIRPGLKDGAIELAVDGSVRFGPVTMDVMGFTIGYNLGTHRPVVPSLRGLSLLLEKPPVRVEGGFLLVDGDFVGKAEITTSKFSLTALGGFTMIGGSPSLFVYGVLTMPLGGPPFFFVEGLAAGFGINRHLTLPTIDDVETFPLVQAAIPGSPAIDLEKLHTYLTPKVGSAFFAAGVKFNSFRMIHGFLLAIVGIDTVTGDYEVALVGTGEWISPPEAPEGKRMAYIRLDILAVMSSRDASVIVQAKLGPDCFVNNPLCHISGGMALATWYGGPHKGDFVLTVGGYHPDFKVPSHYPVPGRLTLDYQITDGIHAGGSLYFALTPSYLMFGIEFNATWSTGPVRAWFDLGLDFLMKFKPLHYDANGHIEIGASVDLWLCTISVSAGADLHIWGPEFGGHASVHLGPFHGDMSFGAPIAPPPPLTADEFKQAFLPPVPADVLSIRPAGGLRTTFHEAVADKDELWQKVGGRKPDPGTWPDELKEVPSTTPVYVNGTTVRSTSRKVLEYMVAGQFDSSQTVDYQEIFASKTDTTLAPLTTLTEDQKTKAREGDQGAAAQGATVLGGSAQGAPPSDPPPSDYVQAFKVVLQQPVWSFNPKDMAIEVESLLPLNKEVTVPPMSQDSADGVKANFTFTLKPTLQRNEDKTWVRLVRDDHGQWVEPSPPPAAPPKPLPISQKRFPPALWKATDSDQMDGKTTLRGGAHQLDANQPSKTRAKLSAGADWGGWTPLTDQASFAEQHHRGRQARQRDRVAYNTRVAPPSKSADATVAAAYAAQVATATKLLNALAEAMNDPALKAYQNPGRQSADPLLDAPLLIPQS